MFGQNMQQQMNAQSDIWNPNKSHHQNDSQYQPQEFNASNFGSRQQNSQFQQSRPSMKRQNKFALDFVGNKNKQTAVSLLNQQLLKSNGNKGAAWNVKQMIMKEQFKNHAQVTAVEMFFQKPEIVAITNRIESLHVKIAQQGKYEIKGFDKIKRKSDNAAGSRSIMMQEVPLQSAVELKQTKLKLKQELRLKELSKMLKDKIHDNYYRPFMRALPTLQTDIQIEEANRQANLKISMKTAQVFNQKQSILSNQHLGDNDLSTNAGSGINKRSVLTQNTNYKSGSMFGQSAVGRSSSNRSRNSIKSGMAKKDKKKMIAMVNILDRRYCEHKLDFWLSLCTQSPRKIDRNQKMLQKDKRISNAKNKHLRAGMQNMLKDLGDTIGDLSMIENDDEERSRKESEEFHKFANEKDSLMNETCEDILHSIDLQDKTIDEKNESPSEIELKFENVDQDNGTSDSNEDDSDDISELNLTDYQEDEQEMRMEQQQLKNDIDCLHKGIAEFLQQIDCKEGVFSAEEKKMLMNIDDSDDEEIKSQDNEYIDYIQTQKSINELKQQIQMVDQEDDNIDVIQGQNNDLFDQYYQVDGGSYIGSNGRTNSIGKYEELKLGNDNSREHDFDDL